MVRPRRGGDYRSLTLMFIKDNSPTARNTVSALCVPKSSQPNQTNSPPKPTITNLSIISVPGNTTTSKTSASSYNSRIITYSSIKATGR